MYTALLEDIIHAHGLGRMIYADDTQVYIVLDDESDCALYLFQILKGVCKLYQALVRCQRPETLICNRQWAP